MATEYVVRGPTVHDLTVVDTVPANPVGVEVETAQLGADKKRIYKYCKASAAFSAGVPVWISSVGALLSAAVNSGTGTSQEIGVPQIAITSPSGSTYHYIQTGGYFDNTGAQSGVGIYAVSATAGQELYLGSSAVSTTPSAAPVVNIGARALSNASTDECYAYSDKPLKAVKDALA